ncbi:MAG TPA: hypothetical protein VHM47_02115 [Actinomycetota bacterium]|jgi:hypothetical protein|nr:hypothetical protein [Actinomycetota bacterium]
MSAPRPALRDRPAPKGFRRLERWLVGLVMAMFAYVIEKAVLRSIKKGNTTPKPVEPTAITGTGADVSAD